MGLIRPCFRSIAEIVSFPTKKMKKSKKSDNKIMLHELNEDVYLYKVTYNKETCLPDCIEAGEDNGGGADNDNSDKDIGGPSILLETQKT